MSVGAVNKSTGDRIPTAGMPAIDAALSGSSTNPVQNMVVKAAFDTIKDGQSINSFADVETALGDKQDAYETITYAQWQALTPAQQAAKDYYISDYPSSVLTAGNIAYDNTSSGMAANKVQGAIDELKSGLTDCVNYASRSIVLRSTTLTLDIPKRFRGFLLTGSVSDTLNGAYIVCANSAGTDVVVSTVKSASNISITVVDGNKITIANASTTLDATVVMINFTV